MRTTPGFTRPAGYGFRLAGRLALIAAAAGYLVFMAVSHTTPFGPGLQVELATGGWLISVSQIIGGLATAPTGWRRLTLAGWRSRRSSRGTLRGRWDLAVAGAIFALLIGSAVAVGATGNLSNDCHSPATCFKIDNWRVVHGTYYRQYPYDAAGNGDSSAPWVRISRAEYVAEVGSLLREAAFFGLFALVVGMVANVTAERASASVAEQEAFI